MQIHYAARRGDRGAVLRQLARGVPINARDEYEGETPLTWAAGSAAADAEFLAFLIGQGADVDAAGAKSGITPLMQAARGWDPRKVGRLIAAGADVRFRSGLGYTVLISGVPATPEITRLLLDTGADTDGETPWSESALSVASRESDWTVVRMLLDAGADPAPLRWTALIRAAVFGSVEEVTAELDAGGDLAAQDRWERTPWLHAVCAGDIPKARLLLERGSDVRARGRGGHTALMYAAMRDDAPMVRWLLTLGTDVNERTPFGDTALHAAAECGATRVIPVLLAAGADVRATDEVATQPIDAAPDIGTVRLLVGAGADINYVNGQGGWLLKSAAEEGNAEFVRDLIAMGASVDTTSTGETALHAAVKADAQDVMRLLLGAGADPNAQDVDGWGVLWSARTTEAVQILLEAGVDLHLTDDMGREALAHHTDTEIQGLLLAAGCYLNPPDNTYGAPLLEAVGRGVADQVRFLLDAGADVNAATNWRQTALMEAAENSFAVGVRLLLGGGADAGLSDENGRTALHHAAAPEAFTGYTLAQESTSPAWLAELAEQIPEGLREFIGTEPVDLGKYGYVESDSVECIELLTEAGADLDAVDAAGLTPLMLAASCGRPSRVAGLLALGADPARRDAGGRTALDHAGIHPQGEQRTLIQRLLSGAVQAEVGD